MMVQNRNVGDITKDEKARDRQGSEGCGKEVQKILNIDTKCWSNAEEKE